MLVIRFGLISHSMCDIGDDVCAVVSVMLAPPAIRDAFRHTVLIRRTTQLGRPGGEGDR